MLAHEAAAKNDPMPYLARALARTARICPRSVVEPYADLEPGSGPEAAVDAAQSIAELMRGVRADRERHRRAAAGLHAAVAIENVHRSADCDRASNEIGAFESGLAARLMGTVPSVIFGGVMTLVVVAVTMWRSPALLRMREIHGES